MGSANELSYGDDRRPRGGIIWPRHPILTRLQETAFTTSSCPYLASFELFSSSANSLPWIFQKPLRLVRRLTSQTAPQVASSKVQEGVESPCRLSPAHSMIMGLSRFYESSPLAQPRPSSFQLGSSVAGSPSPKIVCVTGGPFAKQTGAAPQKLPLRHSAPCIPSLSSRCICAHSVSAAVSPGVATTPCDIGLTKVDFFPPDERTSRKKTDRHQQDSVPSEAATHGRVRPAADDAGIQWDAIPITRLRTVCRRLQLSTKGTKAEMLRRLEEAASTKKVLAVLKTIESPGQAQQAVKDQNEAAQSMQEVATKPKAIRCHVCTSRLSAKARFCSKCGATISVVGQETLKDFVEKAFWPIRQQEVGSNTMRVESGFWQSILQVIGDVPVANLSAAVWEEYLSALKKRNCSPRTQALHQVAYLAALKYAVHTRRLEQVHAFRKIRGCTKRTLPSVPLTAEEVYLLLAATPNTMHCALFAVGIGAGLRPSELLSMRWEDVNMDEMTATIRGSKTAASAAAIPLTNLAGRELMRWWEEEGRPTSGLCFYAEGIRTASSRANLEKKTPIRKRTASLAGLDETRCGEPRRIFPYILRHSFATIAATSNPPVPLPVAQAVMRHTSSKMLLETYAKAGALVIKEGLRNFRI
ncbi:hypothetical protein Efla_000352 [Eimeria flavescens]